MTRVLITGASGFIGSALIAALAGDGFEVRGAYRRPPEALPVSEWIAVGDLSAATDWRVALQDVSTVVHCAGPAHGRFSRRALQEQIVDATQRLAMQALEVGVQRFLYMSSIKAACGRTAAGQAVKEADMPRPEDAYGRAKLAAEAAVLAHPSLRPVLLRPPLVIAPHAKANFGRLLWLAASGLPLPLAGIANQRSLISLSSLVAAVRTVLDHPDGPSGVFHIADRPAMSTSQIVDALWKGLERPSSLFQVPATFLPTALVESLAPDDTRFREAYGEGWAGDSTAAVTECGATYRARVA